MLKPIRSQRRLNALLDNEHRRAAQAARAARRAAQQANAVDVVTTLGRVPKQPVPYPECPHCHGESIRAGKVDGEQRYRCKSCRRTYYLEALIRPVDAGVTLSCYRCGSEACDFKGAGGRPGSGLVGWCRECGKRFTQGGREHLERTGVLLIQRLRALKLDMDLYADVHAQAAADILQGIGYTWNVPLDVPAARKRLYKGFGEAGSTHRALTGEYETRN